jgi:hypothetical protein
MALHEKLDQIRGEHLKRIQKAQQEQLERLIELVEAKHTE